MLKAAVRVLACLAITAAGPALADPKRPLPNYDGRGTEANDGHWALWIPRVAFAPLYFINEYVLRRPIGALVRISERDHWVEAVTDVFTFGPEDQFLLVPTALVDFGLQPSVGLYFSGENVFASGNQVRIHGSTGGTDWLSLTVLDRYVWNRKRTYLAARFEFLRRPDFLFLGIGPTVTEATRARYGLQRIDAAPAFKHKFGLESWITLAAGVRTISYRPGCCADPSLSTLVADQTVPMPPGLGMPYTALYQRAELVVDSRAPVPAPGSGGYLRVHGETDFDTTNDRSWIGYGITVGGAADLTGHQRSVKLQAAVDFVDPIRGEVPFNELAQLGSDLMPGFLPGWMNGRSTFATQIAYTWPIWTELDGELRFSAGNAFGTHLDGLTTRKFRLSGDVGMRTAGFRDAGLEVLFGLGTETIEDGAGITSVRVAIGSRRGF